METKFTWQDVVDAEPGKIFVDRSHEGVRFLIMRGPASLCAYVGIPLDHPLAGFDYDNVPVDCHGGLTFGREGGEGSFPAGFFWYGWDYGHCDDFMISGYHSSFYARYNEGRKKWDVTEVNRDSWLALYTFQKLCRLAENVARKARGEQ